MGRPRARESHDLRVWRSHALEGLLFSRGIRLTHTYPRHWHEELHLCAYTSGGGYLGYRGSSYVVSNGDFVVTPAGDVHENWVASGSSISFRGLYIDSHAFRQACEQLASRDLSISNFRKLVVPDTLVLQCFLKMHLAAQRGDSQLEEEEGLLEFLHLFLSRCSTVPLVRIVEGGEPSAVKQAREYIEEHYTESISLGYLGRLANLSPFHLHRVFCREIGMPPHAYQTQVRINRAKQLLRKRHPLSAVAQRTGFADQSHLTRHFHRLVGMTPGKFLI